MWEKLISLLGKHRDILVYLVFGALTTAVNYLVYLPCYNVMHLSSAFSNVIAWAAAVAFAYVTNKPFVFHSHDWSAKTVLPELIRFVGTRLGSGGLETLVLLIVVDILCMNGNLWKLLTSALVVVLNYIGSRLLVFRKQ